MSSSIVGRNFMQAVFGLPAMVGLLFYILANGRIKNIRYRYVYLATAILFFVGLAYVYKNFNDSKSYAINYTNEYEYYPIKLNQTMLPFADITNLVKAANYLKNKSGRIAMYDDNSRILAVLLNRPSWNTGLTQMYNITIPIDKRKRLEWQEKEIEHIQKNKIEWIVSTLNSSKRRFRVEYQSPPGFLDIERLHKYINNKFVLIKKFDLIEVYKRK
jgi:bifunctional DNA-binding transcriptional regulator/antitoxin component of YhaV-PrlF toxin-antitoxin module